MAHHPRERAGRPVLAPLGSRPGRLLGQNIWQRFPGLAGTRIQAEAFRAHAQGTEVELEEYFAALGRWFSIRIAPTSDGLVCYARELPDDTHAEHALQASEERFRHLVESIDDVVFRLDRDQRCVDAFGRWLEREGFEPASLIGRTTREIVGPGRRSDSRARQPSALAGETVTYDWTLRSRSGAPPHADHPLPAARSLRRDHRHRRSRARHQPAG